MLPPGVPIPAIAVFICRDVACSPGMACLTACRQTAEGSPGASCRGRGTRCEPNRSAAYAGVPPTRTGPLDESPGQIVPVVVEPETSRGPSCNRDPEVHRMTPTPTDRLRMQVRTFQLAINYGLRTVVNSAEQLSRRASRAPQLSLSSVGVDSPLFSWPGNATLDEEIRVVVNCSHGRYLAGYLHNSARRRIDVRGPAPRDGQREACRWPMHSTGSPGPHVAARRY
jgi:hypothetical protein